MARKAPTERKKPGPKPLPPGERMERRSIRMREIDWAELERQAKRETQGNLSELLRRRTLGEA